MNRNFEFRQLLRAFRAGIISEQTFESETTALQTGAGRGRGFTAFGKTYANERDAVVANVDRFRAGESAAGPAFAIWAQQCTNDCIRSGLRMIAERESYHGRIFERRMRDLGAECNAAPAEDSLRFHAVIKNAELSDNEKLLAFDARIANVEETFRPLQAFADSIMDDLETKEAVKLFVEDEISSVKFLKNACVVLNSPAQAGTRKPGARISASESRSILR